MAHMLLPLLLFFASTAFKLLFTHSYHSTDFEVHRNWLAVTHSLPPSEWYFESTSKWTLDYPPLFAWFEWLLSKVAAKVDPKMCMISDKAYSSSKTIWFQRCSVLLSELTLYFSIWRINTIFCKNGNNPMKRRFMLTIALLAFNYGLMVVDHIHFQYNGFLFGVVLLSCSFLIDGCYSKAAACFTVLLNLKHLFLYVAPVYFIYILFNYCLARENRSFPAFIGKLFKVGAVVTIITLISFVPFLSERQLRQIYSRLFPFDRGLTHAYWAPNFWALYNGVDIILTVLNMRFGLWPDLNMSSTSMTRGLVGNVQHVVLPSICPIHTAILVLVGMFLPLVRCAIKSAAFHDMHLSARYREFLVALTGAAWASFLFGWHIHEKAILVVLLPLSLLAMAVPKFRSVAFYVTTLGHYSLIPLIPTKAETSAILFMFLSYTATHWLVLFRLHPLSSRSDVDQTNWVLGCLARVHLWGLIPLYVTSFIVWELLGINNRLPFMPLMATSMYTSIGLFFAYIYFLQLSWRSEEVPVKVTEAKLDENQQVMRKIAQEKKQRTIEGNMEEKPKVAETKMEANQQQVVKRQVERNPQVVEDKVQKQEEKLVSQKSKKKKAKKLKNP